MNGDDAAEDDIDRRPRDGGGEPSDGEAKVRGMLRARGRRNAAREAGDGRREDGSPDGGGEAPRDPAFRLPEERAEPVAERDLSLPRRDEDGDEASRRHALTFRGKQVAVGLRWLIPDDATDVRAFAQSKAGEYEDDPRDLWCSKEQGEPQVGLGATWLGHAAKMPSLAAEIATKLPTEWAGLFGVDGAYYVLSARNGTVDPDSDQAFDDLDTAVRLFKDLCSRGVTKYFVTRDLAEGRYGVADLEVLDLDEVVGKFSVRLKAVSSTNATVRKVGLGVGALLALYVLLKFVPGVWTTIQRWTGFEHKDKTPVVTVGPMPWTGQPKAAEVIPRCIDALSAVPKDAGGWQGRKATCDGRVVTIEYGRTGSVAASAPPINWIIDWAKRVRPISDAAGRDLGRPTLAKTSAQVTVATWNIGPVARWRDSDEPTGRIADRTRDLWMTAEGRFEKSTFGKGAAHPVAVTQKMSIETTMSGAKRYATTLSKTTDTVSLVTLNLESRKVSIDARFHEQGAWPSGNKKILRLPDPKGIEASKTPPAPEK